MATATQAPRGSNPRAGEIALRAECSQIPEVRPDNGGRIELKLTEGLDTIARYALVVFLPDVELSTAVRIDASSGALDLDEWRGGTLPDWLATYTHALLRSLLRTKLSEGDWPRRVTRWRPAP